MEFFWKTNLENEQVNSSTFKFKALIPFDRGIRIKDIPDMGGYYIPRFPFIK